MQLLIGCKLVQKNAILLRPGIEISAKQQCHLGFGKVFGNIADKQLILPKENNTHKPPVNFQDLELLETCLNLKLQPQKQISIRTLPR